MFDRILKKALTPLDEAPVPLPRFGPAPPTPATLPPSVEACHDREHREYRPPLELAWEDPALGLRVEVKEDRNGDVWAYAGASADGAPVNAVVVLARRGGSGSEPVKLPVRGSACVGPIADLRSALGPDIELFAFLSGVS